MFRCLVIVVLTCRLTTGAASALAFEQTYQSCGLSAWENLLAVEMFQDEVPLEKAAQEAAQPENVETAYRLAEADGVAVARIAVMSAYRLCAQRAQAVARDAPPTRTEMLYRDCAHMAASRYLIVLDISRGADVAALRARYPSDLHALAGVLYETYHGRSFASVVADIAAATTACVERAPD